MVFSSIEFIFRFLVIFFIVYNLAPKSIRNLVILFASLTFYAFGEPKYVVLMIVSIVVNHFLTLKMAKSENKKKWAAMAIVFDVAMLGVFKYTNFIVDNINMVAGHELIKHVHIVLPIGISFYTFQIMSYVIDAYRGKFEVEKSILPFATYVSMFPQLIAGPIVNYREVRNELTKRRTTRKDIETGVVAFTIGLAYKVILANQIGTVWNGVQTVGVYGMSTPMAWVGAWSYSFQLLFDFAGYSMMAIGLGRMMGFYFPINFADPYISRSATEFWRRWHITLGRWFREYVYIPLGGNRKGKKRMVLNLFIVWALTGLWHGASWNFVVWGIMFFGILMIEKLYLLKFLEKHYVISRVYMLILIPVSWMIFAITDIRQALLYIARMFFIPIKGMVDINTKEILLKYVGEYWWMLLLCAVCATPLPMTILDKYYNKFVTKVVLLAMFWISIYLILVSEENPFLYFRF